MTIQLTVVTRKEILSNSLEQTQAYGREFAVGLKSGDVAALSGPLGSGKTAFVRGVCAGLGVTTPVTSPSFIIVNEYPGRLPVYHWDLYRLNSLDEVRRLGIEECFASEGVCLVEWAEKILSLLPERRWEIHFSIAGENQRKISFQQFS